MRLSILLYICEVLVFPFMPTMCLYPLFNFPTGFLFFYDYFWSFLWRCVSLCVCLCIIVHMDVGTLCICSKSLFHDGDAGFPHVFQLPSDSFGWLFICFLFFFFFFFFPRRSFALNAVDFYAIEFIIYLQIFDFYLV